MKKRLSTILATVLMAVILIPFTPVQAASADVTGKMAGNRQIKSISKMMTAYTTAMNLSEQSTTKPVKMKLNDNAKLSIAVFVRYNYKGDYSYTAKELRSETKKLFGKSASVNKIKANKTNSQNSKNNIKNGKTNKNNTKNSTGSGNTTMLVCSSNSKFYKDPYMYCGGDFGDVIPDYKITKVVRTGKNTYTVTTQNRLGCYGEKGRTNIGTTTIKVKKSAAGFVVKGISYQYNGK